MRFTSTGGISWCNVSVTFLAKMTSLDDDAPMEPNDAIFLELTAALWGWGWVEGGIKDSASLLVS